MKKPKVSFLCTECRTQGRYFPNQKWCPESDCQGRLIRTDRCLICGQERADPETARCSYCTGILEYLVPLLKERSEPEDSDWPEVTPEDLTLLNRVIHSVIRAKWGTDSDGDLPVETAVVDRTRFQWYSGRPLPYSQQAQTMQEFITILQIAASNARVNTNIFNDVAAEMPAWIELLKTNHGEALQLPLNLSGDE